jgi:hypothetical protein
VGVGWTGGGGRASGVGRAFVLTAAGAGVDQGWGRGSHRVGVLCVSSWAWGGAKHMELGTVVVVSTYPNHVPHLFIAAPRTKSCLPH